MNNSTTYTPFNKNDLIAVLNLKLPAVDKSLHVAQIIHLNVNLLTFSRFDLKYISTILFL